MGEDGQMGEDRQIGENGQLIWERQKGEDGQFGEEGQMDKQNRQVRKGGVVSPCSPLELLAEQLEGGGGEAWGRTTGAKALFCLTAAEKEKTP